MHTIDQQKKKEEEKGEFKKASLLLHWPVARLTVYDTMLIS